MDDARWNVAELRRTLLLEKEAMERESQVLERESEQLKSIMEKVHRLENEAIKIMRAVGTERALLFGAEFRLETRRIQLLKSLRSIYPIRMRTADRQYSIAGILLPDDIHDISSTDEEVSAALGFLCHLVFLTSKYLSISMRHRLVCHSSRSAIVREDGSGSGGSGGFGEDEATAAPYRAAVYPLFRERGVVDREELDRAVGLLHRNVDCLLTSRGASYVPLSLSVGLLYKIERLLAHVIEGDDR